MHLSELARELELTEHETWMLAAQLLRSATWEEVFEAGMHLSPPAEAAIRNTVAGLRCAFGG